VRASRRVREDSLAQGAVIHHATAQQTRRPWQWQWHSIVVGEEGDSVLCVCVRVCRRQRETGTALHGRWLSVTRCGRTQRRCWSQMAGCGLGCAIMSKRASHPSLPPTAAVRTGLQTHDTTRNKDGSKKNAMRCRYPADDCNDAHGVQTMVEGKKKGPAFCSPMSLARRSCHMAQARAGAMTGLGAVDYRVCLLIAISAQPVPHHQAQQQWTSRYPTARPGA
jgi:hypothetical protein